MKRIFVCLLFLSVGFLSYSQVVKDNKMPITTISKQALTFYNEAMKCFDDVALDKGRDLLINSLEEDPDFFMANYQMSLYYSGAGDFEKFSEYAGAAVNCKTKLSQAEELLKSALKELEKGEGVDVTYIGKKLVEMYPADINAYNNLFYFQSFINDLDGGLETLNKALKIAEDTAPLYNQLGYVYLGLKQNEKAEESFDKYIELDPGNPNVYDSKGDYYMYIKDYRGAYEAYMKAHMMDNSWSTEKARNARQLYESTEGKKLEIITL